MMYSLYIYSFKAKHRVFCFTKNRLDLKILKFMISSIGCLLFGRWSHLKKDSKVVFKIYDSLEQWFLKLSPATYVVDCLKYPLHSKSVHVTTDK